MDPGYQTPTEDHHPAFVLTAPPTPTAAHPAALPPPAAATPPRPRPRPPLLRLTSAYMRRRGGNDHSNGNGNGNGNTVPPSLDDLLHKGMRRPREGAVGFRDRVACYQWTFFTMTMATGGIANVLYSIPYREPWLEGVGVAFALLNMILFVMNSVFITMRFRLRPGSFTQSFTDQVESLFIPAFYGIPKTGPWLVRTMEIIFLIYLPISAICSAGMYLVLWSTLVFPIHMMTPTWVFPAYPMLLTCPFATTLIAAADRAGTPLSVDPLGLALGALTAQGTGCLIAFMISAAFIYRLMTQKLPRDFQRPGVFISIGPFAFTVTGIVQLSSLAEKVIPPNFLSATDPVSILRVLAVMAGLWLYGLSLWFFLVSVGSLWKYTRPQSRMPFRMTWWSFVFPNTALVTATLALASALDSEGLRVFGCAMAGLLIVVWLCVFGVMLRCLRTRELLWPKDDL